MQLPYSAAIPAPHRDRQEMAWKTGKRIVDMVHEDLKPSDILTKEAFVNAIRVNSAIGARPTRRSTSMPWPAISASNFRSRTGRPMARTCRCWSTCSRRASISARDYHHAGGVPAVVKQLMDQGLIFEDALTVNGRTLGENCRAAVIEDGNVIRSYDRAAEGTRRFPGADGQPVHLGGDEGFRHLGRIPRALSQQSQRSRGLRGPAIVFDGPEDYHRRIDDETLAIDEHCILFMRGVGPIGYPGAAEVVNMRPPAYLINTRHPQPGLHRRRPAVGHLGLAVDPQCHPRSGGGRQPGPAQDRRQGCGWIS